MFTIAPTTSFDRSSSVENRSSREVRLMFFALLFNLQHLPRERAVCLCHFPVGIVGVNALAAADSVLVPAQPQFLSAKGLEQLLQTVNKVRRQINRNLRIDGILLTMADSRTNYSKEVSSLLRSTYGSKIKIFDTEIPRSVRAAEISAEGKSIYAHDPHGKVAEAYRSLTGEVLKIEKQREKYKSDLSR